MTYVDSLREKRQLVWSELETLRADQRRVTELVGVKEAQLKNIDELLAMEGETSGANGPSDGPRTTVSTFLDVAVDVLRTARAGIHYREVLKQLNTRGVNVPGRDPGANLLAHLGRDDRFVRVGRGTYGLKGAHKEIRSRRRTARKRVRRTKAAAA